MRIDHDDTLAHAPQRQLEVTLERRRPSALHHPEQSEQPDHRRNQSADCDRADSRCTKPSQCGLRVHADQDQQRIALELLKANRLKLGVAGEGGDEIAAGRRDQRCEIRGGPEILADFVGQHRVASPDDTIAAEQNDDAP